MTAKLDIREMLELRKVTRAISEQVAEKLRMHIGTLTPLFSPYQVFGDYLQGGPKSPVRGADKAYEELTRRYGEIVVGKPFDLPPELAPPLDIFAATPVLVPFNYRHAANADGETSMVTVTAPLRWVLGYPELSPDSIGEWLSQNRNKVRENLRHAVLQYLTTEMTLTARPGLMKLLEDLRFPVGVSHMEGLGKMPICIIECPVATIRPSDEIILQSTEVSGVPYFEEVIDLDRLREMPDPFRQMTHDIVRQGSLKAFARLSDQAPSGLN